MNSYYSVSTKQLILNSLLIAFLTVSGFEINTIVRNYFVLPEVYINTKDNLCFKVVNYENGHAFNCQDVDVILRKYRKIIQ